MNLKEIYISLIKKYGKEAQLIVAIEELSELQKEITKNLRGNENTEFIAGEVADVEIMLDQIKTIFPNIDSKVQEYKAIKVERIRQLLKS